MRLMAEQLPRGTYLHCPAGSTCRSSMTRRTASRADPLPAVPAARNLRHHTRRQQPRTLGTVAAKIATVRDIPIHYEEIGEGRPIVLLHGFSMEHAQTPKDWEGSTQVFRVVHHRGGS